MIDDLFQASLLIGAIVVATLTLLAVGWLLRPRRDRYSPPPGRVDTGPRPLPNPRPRRRRP